MVYFADTPEARLGRSDSKNPATTCKGITATGKPCRNPLATSPRASPARTVNGKGVLAVLPHAGGSNDNAAAFYCHHHKDQAPSGPIIAQPHQLDLKNRSSIDTLINRLGVLEIVNETPTKPKRGRPKVSGSGPVKRTTLPQPWQNVPGPLLSVPDNIVAGNVSSPQQPKSAQQFVRPKVREYHFSFFCCMKPDDTGDNMPAARPRPSPETHPAMLQRPPQTSAVPTPLYTADFATPKPRPSRSTPSASRTATLMAWIPDTVAPATCSALLSELTKPLSTQDRDAGYIYMFWETPTSNPHPTHELARSLMQKNHGTDSGEGLLADPWDAVRSADERSGGGGGDGGSRRTSDAARNLSGAQTLNLKIGRADNVQRRMDQWTRQCRKNFTLLRYYPYTSHARSSASSTPSSSSRRKNSREAGAGTGAGAGDSSFSSAKASRMKGGWSGHHPGPVANCARVERLIHVELAGKRVKRHCTGCGKEHREWFEVEASRQGVQMVDEVIRRWVRWGQETGQ